MFLHGAEETEAETYTPASNSISGRILNRETELKLN